MVLAAGRGTRLGPLGLRVPKILLQLGGEPLLARQLRYLAAQGATRVVVNAHHLVEQVQAFAAGYDGALELVLVEEVELLGTAGGVRNALEHLRDGPFVVLYGDVLMNEPLDPIVRMHREREAAATLTVYEGESTVGKGVVEGDETSRVARFVEKEANRKGPGLINAGLYVLDPALVEALPPQTVLDFGHDVLPAAVERGEPIVAYRLREPVLDVGTPEAVELAEAMLSQEAERGDG